VNPSSAAEEYGLQKGDIITAICGHSTQKMTHHEALDLIYTSGSSLKLLILRGSKSTIRNPPNSVPNVGVWTPPWRNRPQQQSAMNADRNQQLVRLVQQSMELEEDLKKRSSNAQAFKSADQFAQVRNAIQPRFRSVSQDRQKNPTTDFTSYPNRQPVPPRRAITPGPENFYYRTYQMSPAAAMNGSMSPSVLEMKPIPGGTLNDVHGYIEAPDNKRIVHLQYNSPMHLYSPSNAVDMIEKTTGTKAEWLYAPPPQNYSKDMQNSPTYKFIAELEGRTRPTRARSVGFEQSRVIKALNRYFHLDDD